MVDLSVGPVPLCLVLYMLSHAPTGMQDPVLPTSRARRFMHVRYETPEDDTVWAIRTKR